MKMRKIDNELFIDEATGNILSLDDLVTPEQTSIVEMIELFIRSLVDDYEGINHVKNYYHRQLINNPDSGAAAFLTQLIKQFNLKIAKNKN